MVINDAHKSILSPHGFPLVQFQLWTCKKRSRDVRHRARTIIWTGNREHRQLQFDTYVTCLTYVLLIIRTCPKHCKCSELGKTIPGSNRAPRTYWVLPASRIDTTHLQGNPWAWRIWVQFVGSSGKSGTRFSSYSTSQKSSSPSQICKCWFSEKFCFTAGNCIHPCP